MMVADYIVVGAGSAGAVVAARLSEDGARSALLLETGPDNETEAKTPPKLLDSGRLPLQNVTGYVRQDGPGSFRGADSLNAEPPVRRVL